MGNFTSRLYLFSPRCSLPSFPSGCHSSQVALLSCASYFVAIETNLFQKKTCTCARHDAGPLRATVVVQGLGSSGSSIDLGTAIPFSSLGTRAHAGVHLHVGARFPRPSSLQCSCLLQSSCDGDLLDFCGCRCHFHLPSVVQAQWCVYQCGSFPDSVTRFRYVARLRILLESTSHPSIVREEVHIKI